VKESFSDKKERLRTQMSGTASRVGEAAPDGEEVKKGARQMVGVAEENPIGLALGGLGGGFLAGMLLPSTKLEDRRVGPMADELKSKAKETAEEAVERGKEVTSQVTEQAVETAKEVGREEAEALRASAVDNVQEVNEAAKQS
jgi:hypothetical protein